MRKSIIIDKNKLGEMKYKGSPLRQILALSISAEHQLLLLNFFSHSDIWKLSLNSIANHSFGIKKNRDRVKKSLEQLEAMGLITITDDTYTPNLDNIQKQYLTLIEAKKVLKTDTLSTSNITDTLSTIDTLSTTLPDTLSTTLPDTLSTTLPDTLSTSNLIPSVPVIKRIELKEEKLKEDKNENETIERSFSDVKSFSSSTPIKNDYDLVYNSSEHFRRIIANANWNKESIRNHSNAFIATNVFKYNSANEKEKELIRKSDKTISLQHYLTKFACRLLPESQLRKEYEHECNINDKPELITFN